MSRPNQLTQEQITELLATPIKPNKYGEYSPPKYEPPKQSGPVRFKDDRTLKCQYITEGTIIKAGTCLSPCHMMFQGKPMCHLHIIRSCNAMLIELGILE